MPPELEAGEPAEARGLARDEVRLMVGYRRGRRLVHTRFRELPATLRPGDLLVVNTSGTIPASLPASAPGGLRLRLHLSNRLSSGRWLVELRSPRGFSSDPYPGGRPGLEVRLPEGGSARILEPHRPRGIPEAASTRLWEAQVRVTGDLLGYLGRHGRPIQYGYTAREWPIAAYQTVFAAEPGSAEMPSAGRGFTHELVTRLVGRGILVAPVLLHTGVSSLENAEPPYPEWYRVPPATARLVRATRGWGGRVVAVGTTVVRALESSTGRGGEVQSREGWTDLVVTPDRPVATIDGLLTGWHRLEASHLLMLEAVAGRELLEESYREALAKRYLWHEFGDLHLILP